MSDCVKSDILRTDTEFSGNSLPLANQIRPEDVFILCLTDSRLKICILLVLCLKVSFHAIVQCILNHHGGI